MHRPLISIASTVGRRLEMHGLAVLLCFLVGTIALCVALHHWYDVPVRRWLLRRFALNREPPAREASAP